MPEGDTVYRTARRLDVLNGQVLTTSDFRIPSLAEVDLVGRTVLETISRGKHLLTRLADGVTIQAFSHLEGARVASGATLGPYARLRPGADIGEGAHVGNFVEIKKATLGKGAKANHLAYLGDASIGAGSNVGAGAITCNYDGFAKHRTTIGERVFVGSDAVLVAPLTIGDGAFVAAGSVITQNVASDAMAFGRAVQVTKPGLAATFRNSRRRG